VPLVDGCDRALLGQRSDQVDPVDQGEVTAD
jgi:hypothetical protein